MANSPEHEVRILGESPAIQKVFDLIDRVAGTPATVLLTGESGTGKEAVAREIHHRGNPADAPFVLVNCAAIPENLIEAELFGYQRGAFTDAKINKKGLFELAEGGTLFLDEVGLLPLDLQAKLLSVLENRAIRRLGGMTEIATNARIIAATNENVEQAVSEGRFRKDLLYRLNVYPILLPPLKDRGEDVLIIADHFLHTYRDRYGKPRLTLSKPAERWLSNHDFPGNIRELRNLIERAVLLSDGTSIDITDLAVGSEPPAQGTEAGLTIANFGEIRIEMPPWGIAIEDVERKLILAALETASGNVSRAAELLHISRDTLRYRLKKFGLPPDPRRQ